MTELIASDSNAYVELAVKIACEPNCRSTLQKRIIAARGQVFEHSSAAKELEDCLLEVVADATSIRADASSVSHG